MWYSYVLISKSPNTDQFETYCKIAVRITIYATVYIFIPRLQEIYVWLLFFKDSDYWNTETLLISFKRLANAVTVAARG